MQKFGYSKSYSNSGHIKKTKIWNELLEERLSDDELSKVHQKLLNKIEIDHYTFPATEADESIKETIESFGLPVIKITLNQSWKRAYFTIMDANAAAKALDMAYKLKEKYGAYTIKHKFSDLSDEDIERETAGIVAEAIELANGEKEEN